MSVKETLAITQRNSLIYTYIGPDWIWRALTRESGRKQPQADILQVLVWVINGA